MLKCTKKNIHLVCAAFGVDERLTPWIDHDLDYLDPILPIGKCFESLTDPIGANKRVYKI